MFLDITEPKNIKKNDAPERIVGIDFGTTNSLIAYCNEEGVKIIPNIDGADYLKSIVKFEDVEISSIKRVFGKDINEIKNGDFLSEYLKSKFFLSENAELVLKSGNKEILPIEIGAEIFKKLKHNAEVFLNGRVTKAVVTVPAYFDDAGKNMVKSAAKLAGLDVVRMLAEPTAAAYSYNLDEKSEGHYLVYDIGGGTFDISLLSMKMGAFQVLATDGDNLLGGDDIDREIAIYIKERENLNISAEGEIDFLKFARDLKEKSSAENDVVGSWEGKQIIITPEELKDIVGPLLSDTIVLVKKMIRASKLQKLAGIILVGGTTKFWAIKELIKKELPSFEIIDAIDPDKAVVVGAAKQGWNLTSKTGDILIDATPLSLGLELMGGVVEKIIARNSPIPASVSRKYTTYVDNQTGFDFHIVQGDRELAADCRSLARFSLTSIPPMPAGKAIVEVSFTIDSDGLLTVTSKEILSGKKQEVIIKPSYGLSEKKITKMLKEAMENAEYDHFAGKYAEKIIEIDSVIFKMQNLLSKNSDLLSWEESGVLEKLILQLQESMKSSNYIEITDKFDELTKESEIFIERLMSKELTAYLKGKNTNEFL